MVQFKWFVTLVATAALAVAITYSLTEKYVTERTIGQLAELSISRNSTYVVLVREIDEGKCDVVRMKLRKLFDFEVKNIQSAKAVMESSWLASANRDSLDRLDRYLAVPDATSGK